MNNIFKYPLKVQDVQMVEMPKGAAILCLQTQGETPCIWAEVDPKADSIHRCFVTYRTGHPKDDGAARHYVGTYQLQEGSLVFHVYTDRVEYPVDKTAVKGIPGDRAWEEREHYRKEVVQLRDKVRDLQKEAEGALACYEKASNEAEAEIEVLKAQLAGAKRLVERMAKVVEAARVMRKHQEDKHQLSSCCTDVTPTASWLIKKALEELDGAGKPDVGSQKISRCPGCDSTVHPGDCE